MCSTTPTSGCFRKKIKFSNIKNLIIIASGKGGVGKSTIAANLCIYLAHLGYKIGLLDADIYGPSIPQIMGIEKNLELESTSNKFILPEAYLVKVASVGLLAQVKDQALIWRGPLISKMLFKLLVDSLWGPLDYLIIDTPPGTGDILLSLGENYFINGAIIISTPQQLALNEASKSCQTFRKLDIPILGIIENMSYFNVESSNNDNKKLFIFGEIGTSEIESKFSIPQLGQIPLIPSICSLSDAGQPAVFNKTIEHYYGIITTNLLQKLHI